MAGNLYGGRPVPVFGSLIVALMLTLAPMPDWLAPFRPDWVTMTLIYWAIHLPRSCGVGVAWVSGLLLDVALGTLLAQHALAMSLAVYLTARFHLQLRVFPVLQLAATVLALLALYRFILFWINGVAGVSVPHTYYWGPVLSSALLWPLLATALRVFRIPRRGSA